MTEEEGRTGDVRGVQRWRACVAVTDDDEVGAGYTAVMERLNEKQPQRASVNQNKSIGRLSNDMGRQRGSGRLPRHSGSRVRLFNDAAT